MELKSLVYVNERAAFLSSCHVVRQQQVQCEKMSPIFNTIVSGDSFCNQYIGFVI